MVAEGAMCLAKVFPKSFWAVRFAVSVESISNKMLPCGSFVAFRTVAVVEGSALLRALFAKSTNPARLVFRFFSLSSASVNSTSIWRDLVDCLAMSFGSTNGACSMGDGAGAGG